MFRFFSSLLVKVGILFLAFFLPFSQNAFRPRMRLTKPRKALGEEFSTLALSLSLTHSLFAVPQQLCALVLVLKATTTLLI